IAAGLAGSPDRGDRASEIDRPVLRTDNDRYVAATRAVGLRSRVRHTAPIPTSGPRSARPTSAAGAQRARSPLPARRPRRAAPDSPSLRRASPHTPAGEGPADRTAPTTRAVRRPFYPRLPGRSMRAPNIAPRRVDAGADPARGPPPRGREAGTRGPGRSRRPG